MDYRIRIINERRLLQKMNGDYVALAVTAVIFGGLLVYIVRLSLRIKKLEKWRP